MTGGDSYLILDYVILQGNSTDTDLVEQMLQLSMLRKQSTSTGSGAMQQK